MDAPGSVSRRRRPCARGTPSSALGGSVAAAAFVLGMQGSYDVILGSKPRPRFRFQRPGSGRPAHASRTMPWLSTARSMGAWYGLRLPCGVRGRGSGRGPQILAPAPASAVHRRQGGSSFGLPLRQHPNFDPFHDVLVPGDGSGDVGETSLLEHERIYRVVFEFLTSRDVANASFVISLSGGVDSMVLSHCLVGMRERLRLTLRAVHVDYGARNVSAQEARFVRTWAADVGLPLDSVEVDGHHGMRRSDSERHSRQARYQAYRDALVQSGSRVVLTGHHRDDAAENVLNNIVMGRSLFEVPMLLKEASIEGVAFWRPLAGVGKQEIRAFAARQRVPHLKDNDLPGTRRAVLRGQVLPALSQEFGDRTAENIVRVGITAQSWKTVVDRFVLAPVRKSVHRFEHGAVIPLHGYLDLPAAFWEAVLLDVFHGLSCPMLTKSTLDQLVSVLHSGRSALLDLHKSFQICVDQEGERLIIVHSQLLQPPVSKGGGAWSLWQRRAMPNEWSINKSGLEALLTGHMQLPLGGAVEKNRLIGRDGYQVGSEPDSIPRVLVRRLPRGVGCARQSKGAEAGDVEDKFGGETMWVLEMKADVTRPVGGRRSSWAAAPPL